MITLYPSSRAVQCLRLISFSLITSVLIGSNAQAAKPKPIPFPAPVPAILSPRYFFTADLDPRYQIIGTGELTEAQAELANCYRFSYDQDGKLKEIDYHRAGLTMRDPLFGVASVSLEYAPGVERRWYRDTQGASLNNIDGIAGEELTLNPAGYPVGVTNLNVSGGHVRDSSGVIRYVRTLDDRNRVISARRIGLLGTAITDSDGFFETRTAYDDQGRSMERGNYDRNGNLLNNGEGIALIRTTYTLYPDATQSSESYFNAAGTAAADKDTGAHILQRVVDNRGLLLDESYFDTMGAPTLDISGEIHERRYTYDARGNRISEEFFGVDGKAKNERTRDFARVTYKYNEKNLVSEIAFFGDDGTPQVLLNLGAAIIRQEYDDAGTLIRRRFFDGQGNPSPHKVYGAPAIVIKVVADTTIITLRDANDKPMQNPISGYAAFSYKTDKDHPLSLTNRYFDRHGRSMSLLRVRIINPHLYALKTTPVMQASARYGAGAAGLGALLGAFLALRKSSHTKRRKVYVPTAFERFLGWFSAFAIFEGTLRFFITIYWAWVGYENGSMGSGVYILEGLFIAFFIYRLFRMRVTMRVLNIERADIHRLVRAFLEKAGFKPEWIESRNAYTTPPFDVRVNFFGGKYHAYLAFRRRTAEGLELTRGLSRYIRIHVCEILAPPRSRALAFYYPSIALCYFLLSLTGFYTLWQLIKRY